MNNAEKKSKWQIGAHCYNRLGFNLIPLNAKTPCVPWKRWETDRVPPEVILRWLRDRIFEKAKGGTWRLGADQAHNLNAGILTGLKPYNSTPAIICIDADDAAAVDVVAHYCPPTPVMQSTSRGRHAIYRRPAGVEYIANSSKRTIGGKQYHIDIRGDHGYFAAPGSTKGTFVYQWDEPWTLELINAAPEYDPTWLPDERPAKTVRGSATVRRRAESDAYADAEHEEVIAAAWLPPLSMRLGSARHYLAACPGAQQGRGADNYAYAIAKTLLWGFCLPEEEAYELLWEWGQKLDNLDESGEWYPWEPAEIQHKIDSTIRGAYHGEPGDKCDRLRYLEASADAMLAQFEKNAREREQMNKGYYHGDERGQS